MKSVHLQNFPSVSAIAEEAQLVADMDRVREICTAALSVRERENIRVRQPLARLTVYISTFVALHDYFEIIKDEINVKEIKYSGNIDDVANLVCQVDFREAGKRLGPKMKEVGTAVKQDNYTLNDEGLVVAAGETLLPNEYSLKLQIKPGITGAQALSSNDALVVLDLTITPELKAEGLARDVVRAIQQARKDADLNVTDRINVKLEASEELRAAIAANEPYIKEQVLASSLAFLPVKDAAHRAESEVEGGKVVIGLDVAA